MTLKNLCLILSLAFFVTEAYGIKKFVAYPQKLKFFQAWQTCRLYGGYLAAIETAQENDQAFQAAKVVGDFTKGYFIGGTDIGAEGRFIWIGLNIKVAYVNWAPGEPNSVNNEDCIALGSGGKWNDVQCDNLMDGFICAYEVK